MNNEERKHLTEYVKEQNNGQMVLNGYHCGRGVVTNHDDGGFDRFKQFEDNEDITEDTIFIGSEVETGRENRFTDTMLNKMADLSKDFQCESDSSICDYNNNNWNSCYSCEIISAPLTYDYWHKSANYKELFEYLKSINVASYGITNHATGEGCGCHFHLSKVKGWQKAVVYMSMFVDQNKFIVEAICGRPFTGYARNNLLNVDDFYKKVPDLVENHILNHINHSYIINLSNDKTIEFRLCQGTLNYETYMARLEFVYHLYKQCLEIANGKARLDRLTINQICQYGEYLPSYIKKLGISCSNKIENKTREYRQMIEEFITKRNTLRHHLQAVRTLIEESERFENIDNAYRTISGNLSTLANYTENTIESITRALKAIKNDNENTLSRALDIYAEEHPTTALAKEYSICKEFIQNLVIPTTKVAKEEL